MLALILLSVPVLVLLYLHFRAPAIHRDGKRLPHPADTLPILGNAIRFLQPRHVLFDWFIKQQSALDGETYEIFVPSLPPGVVINGPENIEFVLKNESVITKGGFFRSRSWDLFGYGIINATSSLWRLQRKAGLKFFSGDNLSSMISDVLPNVFATTTLPTLKDHSSSKKSLDLQALFLDLTTSLVGTMAYSQPISSSSPFSIAFDSASTSISHRFQNPIYPLTEFLFTGRTLQKAIHEVKSFGASIVARAKRRRGHLAMQTLVDNEPPPNFKDSENLIDSLLETFEGDPTIVADAAMNFLSAGRDTTAQAMTWTFYALFRHPGSFQKLRHEIDTHLPSCLEDLDISHLQPQSLPYTYATLYESLRLYPPVPLEIKQTLQPITLPDGTSLLKDAIIVWCIWSLNRSTHLYGSDALDFKPERWLDDQGHFQAKSAFEFPVFNGGPRACLGKKMAEVMCVWVLIAVLGRKDDGESWEFEEVVEIDRAGRKKERVSQSSLTLPMEGGLPARVRCGMHAQDVAVAGSDRTRQARVDDE